MPTERKPSARPWATAVHEPVARELAAVGDSGVRLGQAVRAGEVAVVGRIEPEPVAGTAFLDGSGEPFVHLSNIRTSALRGCELAARSSGAAVEPPRGPAPDM